MGMLDYLQKSHAIEILLTLSANEDMEWKEVQQAFRKESITISDGTYRARCKELVELGLVTAKKINPLKFKYVLTTKGVSVAGILKRCARVQEFRTLCSKA